jgi:hypothetical protein
MQITMDTFTTFLAPKDHDDEDTDPVYKEKKATDDPKFIHERKGNSVYIKLAVKPLVTTDIQVTLPRKEVFTILV